MKTIKTLLVAVFISATQHNFSQGYLETQQLISSEIQLAENYGFDVAIDGDFAVVGAVAKAITSTNQGGAYVLQKQSDGSWSEHQILLAPDRRQFDSFAQSVAIYDDVIVIGSIGQDYDENNQNFISAAGAVYIYKKDSSDNWNFFQKIIANDRISDGYFGFAVDIYQNTIIVGATRDDFDANGSNFLNRAGSAYIFEEDTSGMWMQVGKINASERATEDRFGNAVTIHEDWIAVGARLEDEDENDQNTISGSGSVFLYHKNTDGDWEYSQKIVPLNRNGVASFGWSLDLQDDILVVGALFTSLSQNQNEGTVHVFNVDISDIWSETQILSASDGSDADRFGYDVAINEDIILVGTPEDKSTDGGMTNDHGSVYMFLKNGTTGEWLEQQKILVSNWQDSEPQDFGHAIAISGNEMIIGNPIAHEIDPDTSNEIADAGAVYMFSFDEDLTLSITDQQPQLNIKAFPNPTDGEVYFNAPSVLTNTEVQIFDATGKKVFQNEFHELKQLRLPDVSGFYILQMKYQGTSYYFKILKK